MLNKETIKNFLDEHFPGYGMSGHEYNFSSPFFADRGKRLYVNANTGEWFDFHEGRGGSFQSFVSEYLGVTYQEACKILDNDYSVVIQKGVDIRDLLYGNTKENIVLENQVVVKDPLDVSPKMFDDCEELDDDGELALRYLNDRRISPSGLGYFGKDDGEYSGRIFVPFYENGELVYFLARSYTGSDLRYKNPHGLNSEVVFNYDKINDTVVIFEGTFDAMSLENMVGTAILSNKMREGQARKIMGIESLKNIIFVPDKDKKDSTRKVILNNLIENYNMLNSFRKPSRDMKFYVYDIPGDYKDFGEYKQETGCGEIDIKDCRPFSKNEILFRIARLK